MGVFRSMKCFWIKLSGHSMTPLLQSGDDILIAVQDPNDLRPADIVLFYDQTSKELTLHRFIGETLTTKGDFSCVLEVNPRESLLGKAIGYKRNNIYKKLPKSGSWIGRLFLLLSLMRMRGYFVRKYALLGLMVLTKFPVFDNDKTSLNHTEVPATYDL